MKRSALVIFKDSLSLRDKKRLTSLSPCDVVIAPQTIYREVVSYGATWVDFGQYVVSGSIHEANTFVQELSLLTMQNGERITNQFHYKGYELWWIHYNSIFHALSIPYTQYKNLLLLLSSFDEVHLFEPPHEFLFTKYLEVHGRTITVHEARAKRRLPRVPFGVFIQILLTLVGIPMLALFRHRFLIFTGDKFAEGKDYDSRMSFIYEEMRRRGLSFVEFVRSLENWKTVWSHALYRKRPTVYPVAIQEFCRFLSVVTFTRYRRRKVLRSMIEQGRTVEERFKMHLALRYGEYVDADIWAIQITKWILRIIGVRAVFVPTTTERNLHMVLACKLLGIPTVGILHGAAVYDYNVYDFLPTYDGEKMITLDRYGLWSDWWMTYYRTHGRAYREDQLYISGPMRPLVRNPQDKESVSTQGEPIKVLFISEQLAAFNEVVPYIRRLLGQKDIELCIKFRPYRDGFEVWLQEHHPDILKHIGQERIFRGSMQEAILRCDIVVGSHSTAVLEALLVRKPFVFFATQKWGDCFDLKNYSAEYTFYAPDADVLMECIHKGTTIRPSVLDELREDFFGDPFKNGSVWVVEQLVLLSER